MTVKSPSRAFPRVKEAREALREKALEILESYLETVKSAKAKGDDKLVLESLQWLMARIPEVDGQRMLDASVDAKNQLPQGPTGPTINIGLAVGGIEPTTIEVSKVEPKELDE